MTMALHSCLSQLMREIVNFPGPQLDHTANGRKRSRMAHAGLVVHGALVPLSCGIAFDGGVLAETAIELRLRARRIPRLHGEAASGRGEEQRHGEALVERHAAVGWVTVSNQGETA